MKSCSVRWRASGSDRTLSGDSRDGDSARTSSWSADAPEKDVLGAVPGRGLSIDCWGLRNDCLGLRKDADADARGLSIDWRDARGEQGASCLGR